MKRLILLSALIALFVPSVSSAQENVVPVAFDKFVPDCDLDGGDVAVCTGLEQSPTQVGRVLGVVFIKTQADDMQTTAYGSVTVKCGNQVVSSVSTRGMDGADGDGRLSVTGTRRIVLDVPKFRQRCRVATATLNYWVVDSSGEVIDRDMYSNPVYQRLRVVRKKKITIIYVNGRKVKVIRNR